MIAPVLPRPGLYNAAAALTTLRSLFPDNHSFQPKLCQKSLDLTASRPKFHSRIGEVIENHRKAMNARTKAKVKYTFQPKMTERTAEMEKKLSGRGDLYKRLADDISQRREKLKANERAQVERYPYKPKITASPKGTEVKGTFLERLSSDLDQRKSRAAPAANSADCTFQPVLSKTSLKLAKGAGKFMDRLTDDLDKRREKQEQIKKELAKPPKFPKKKK